MRSVTGSNLRNIELEVGENIVLENLRKTFHHICRKIEFENLPDEEAWRIAAMKEVALVKSGHMVLEGFSEEEVGEMLRVICIK